MEEVEAADGLNDGADDAAPSHARSRSRHIINTADEEEGCI